MKVFNSKSLHYFLCLQVLSEAYQVLSNPLQRDAHHWDRENYISRYIFMVALVEILRVVICSYYFSFVLHITAILKNNKVSTIRTIFEFQFHFLYSSFMEWLFLFNINFGHIYSIYYIVKPNKPTHLARSNSQTEDKIVINLTMITIQIIMLLETLIIERDVSLWIFL